MPESDVLIRLSPRDLVVVQIALAQLNGAMAGTQTAAWADEALTRVMTQWRDQRPHKQQEPAKDQA